LFKRPFFVRPVGAHYHGCKSCGKLITTSEAMRNCFRAADFGIEKLGAQSVI